MPDYVALKAKLAEPAYAALGDAEAATLLNAPGASVPGVVPQNELLMWGAETGARLRITLVRTAGLAAGASAEAQFLGGICITIEDLLGAGSIGLDCAKPTNLILLGQLVAAGICSQAQADDLVARGATPGPSAALLSFGAPVTDKDVAHARSLN